MRTLYLLRHAKSSWDEQLIADHDRPLAPRGRKDARAMCEHLRTLDVPPQLVLCSSSVRTRQTLDLVAPAMPDADVEIEEVIYAASASTLLDRLREVDDAIESAMVIAHNPGIEELAMRLSGDGAEIRAAGKFPTCALATLAFEGDWAALDDGAAELADFATGRQLRA
jgi:phosphohistidine phosphatase